MINGSDMVVVVHNMAKSSPSSKLCCHNINIDGGVMKIFKVDKAGTCKACLWHTVE